MPGKDLSTITCLEDLRQLSRRRVPRAFFQHADHGAYAGLTAARNISELQAIELRQRVMRDMSQLDLTSSFLGTPARLPLALGPVGLAGMHWPDGEVAAAGAAQTAGVPFCLSTMSICSLEKVAQSVPEPIWFQLYMAKDRGFVSQLIERALAVGCNTLVLTVDLPVLGQRHCDIRNGMAVPPRVTLRTAMDFLTHPSWCLRAARGDRSFGTLAGYLNNSGIASMGRWVSEQLDPSITAADIDWVRQRWPGKLIIKGILDPDDASLAFKAGADAIVVSNHGGRQLDGAPSTISVLPAIANATRGMGEVYLDSGIRSGQDIFRALALGAKGILLGRAWVYALGAGGQPAVARMLQILSSELSVTMTLTGVSRISDISTENLQNSPG